MVIFSFFPSFCGLIILDGQLMFFYGYSYCLHMSALFMIFLDIVEIIYAIEKDMFIKIFELPVNDKSQLSCSSQVFCFVLSCV